MLDDPLLGWTFEGVDRSGCSVTRSRSSSRRSAVPTSTSVATCATAHAALQAAQPALRRRRDHLIESLREAGISDGVLAELAIRLEPLRTQIVTPLARAQLG